MESNTARIEAFCDGVFAIAITLLIGSLVTIIGVIVSSSFFPGSSQQQPKMDNFKSLWDSISV